MKKRNLHFSFDLDKIIEIYFKINLIMFFLIMVSGLFVPHIKTTMTAAKKDEVIIIEPRPNWDNIKSTSLKQIELDRELDGHFTDPETTGCFFLTMGMLNYPVDIDKFYSTFFNEQDIEIAHEGKVSPEQLYQISLIYASKEHCNISIEDISNKSDEFLLSAIKNNYPIITWYGKDPWPQSSAYVIYSIDENNIYMYNIHSSIKVDIGTFLRQRQINDNRVIVYGKYW